jgi:hypothetical protein
VIKQTEEKNFLGIARAIVDVADRARNKKLAPDEISGGTFTLTNSGIFGEQFGTPIINQPQAAILGIGGLNKEAEVLTDKDGNDSIAIRSIQRFTLGFDHRIVDGADAGKFMSDFNPCFATTSRTGTKTSAINGTLATFIQIFKQRVSRRLKPASEERFWTIRYYDFNVHNEEKRIEKMRYIHRNPVKRGLAAHPEDYRWSSFNHYATGARGIVEIESEWTARRREPTSSHP